MQLPERNGAYGVQVCALVLGAVAGVAESLLAARMLTQVWLLPSVTPQVNLEVLKPRKCLVAPFKLKKPLKKNHCKVLLNEPCAATMRTV